MLKLASALCCYWLDLSCTCIKCRNLFTIKCDSIASRMFDHVRKASGDAVKRLPQMQQEAGLSLSRCCLTLTKSSCMNNSELLSSRVRFVNFENCRPYVLRKLLSLQGCRWCRVSVKIQEWIFNFDVHALHSKTLTVTLCACCSHTHQSSMRMSPCKLSHQVMQLDHLTPVCVLLDHIVSKLVDTNSDKHVRKNKHGVAYRPN